MSNSTQQGVYLGADDPVLKVLDHLKDHKRAGEGWTARCPAHDDRKASLSVSRGENAGCVVYCHAGCKTPDVLKAVGLTMADLSPPKQSKAPMQIVSTFDYRDAAGELLFQTVKFHPKNFRQRRPNGSGWLWNLQGVPRILYRLPELIQANPAATVYLPEGERDVDRLAELGLAATCNPMGAGKWPKVDSSPLKGRNVLILPDNDAPGREHAQQVAADLAGKAASVRILELPNLPDKGDVSDWLDAGGTAEQLVELAAQAPAPQTKPPKLKLHPASSFVKDAAVHEAWPCHDLGNADRFANRHGEDVRWLDEQGRWLVWDGRIWSGDRVLDVHARAESAARAIFDEAKGSDDDDERKALASWAARSCGAMRLRAMLDLAKHKVADLVEDYDQDRWLLSVENGYIDLHTGKLKAHDRKAKVSKQCPTVYAPEAKCPLWDRFLSEIMDGDDELIGFLQRVAGYCLTGDVSAHVLPILYGTGANGKSTFLDTLLGIMGDYADQAPPDLLTIRKGQEHPTEIAFLFGKRLVVSSEFDEARKFRVALAKAMTGDARLTGRFMRADYFSFDRTHKTILATNHKPIVSDPTDSTWRRLKLVPFAVTIPTERQDSALLEKLRSEWPGVLAWAVRGCLDWQRNGLQAPAAVEHATSDYRAESDPVASFLEERCTSEPGYLVEKSRIYTSFCEWCKANGEEVLSQRQLGEHLRLHGYADRLNRMGGKPAKVWRGLMLRPENGEA